MYIHKAGLHAREIVVLSERSVRNWRKRSKDDGSFELTSAKHSFKVNLFTKVVTKLKRHTNKNILYY